jgi:hypothetical protein
MALVRTERAGILVTTLALAACTSPATYVEVVIDTDAPSDRAMTVSATVTRSNEPSVVRTPLLIERGGGVGQTTFPTSFSVVPRAGGGRDDAVTLQLEATIRARAAGEPDIRFRRTARWRFTRGSPGQVRVFLPVRCGTITEGCSSASPCTIAALCEENGLTCGNDGTCVAPDVIPEPVSDAGVRDASAPFDSGIDTGVAARDTGVDTGVIVDTGAAPMDTGVIVDTGVAPRDTGVIVDAGVIVDTGVADSGAGLPPGRVCANGAQCAGGVCVSDMVLRQVCSNGCVMATQCPAGWSCTGRSQCEPPRSCGGNFQWTDWNGDGSLRLSAGENFGLFGASTYTYACSDATSRITLCNSTLDLSLTGAQTSVLRGPITSLVAPGARVATNIRAMGPQLFVALDNTQHLYDINVDAPATEVIIRATSNMRDITLVGTIRARELYLDVPAGSRIVNTGMVQCRLTITSNGTYVNMGSMMGLRSNVPAPATPAGCP